MSQAARNAIDTSDEPTFVSAASAWEIATKFRLGKLPAAAPLVPNFESMVAGEGFLPLPITLPHGHLAGSMRGSHKDPFDRILIAQALIDGMTLVSNETSFDAYGVMRLW